MQVAPALSAAAWNCLTCSLSVVYSSVLGEANLRFRLTLCREGNMILLQDCAESLLLYIFCKSTHPEVGRYLAEPDEVGKGSCDFLEAQVTERSCEEGNEVLELRLRDIDSKVIKRHCEDSVM